MARDADSLLRSPLGIPRKDPDALTTVLDNLATTGGVELEIFTRTTPTLAKAALLGYIYNTMIIDSGESSPGCPYVLGRIEQLERFAVSMDGGGRADQIAALQSSKPPEEAPATYEEVDRCQDARTKVMSLSIASWARRCTFWLSTLVTALTTAYTPTWCTSSRRS